MALQERDSNVPRRMPPVTTASQIPSKLPRRVATPENVTLNTPKWSSSVADRVTALTKSAASPATPGSGHETNMTLQSQQRSSTAQSIDKPLPSEKPLPSRPIARISNRLSPSKDSRSLIDASEKPLSFTNATGEKCDWPVLKPRSVCTTPDSTIATASLTPQDTTAPVAPAQSVTPASVIAAAATLTQVITGRSSCCKPGDEVASPSPPSSYVSAHEHSFVEQNEYEPGSSAYKPRDSISSTRRVLRSSASVGHSPSLDLGARQASLRKRISEGSFVDPSPSSSHHCMGFTDFTKDVQASPSTNDSRPHSPSPASFSRPRPGSLSQGTPKPKNLKTASRIPIPDTKKATVIDVKKKRPSSTSAPKPVPSFGSRRLASPDALRILENGKLRRQLKRMPTDGSLSRLRAERAWDVESNGTASTFDTPSLSHSIDTSPDGTLAPNSPEGGPENLIRCPVISPQALPAPDEKEPLPETPTPWDDSLLEEELGTSDDDKDNGPDLSLFRQPPPPPPPPPTSPFTLPLQTIPSGALLPVDNSLQDGEIHAELTHALSRLEGKGSPPKTDVDHQTLLHMFGHLKRGMKKSTEEGANLAENAATAEKYLAQNPSVTSNAEKKAESTCTQSGTRQTFEGKVERKASCMGKSKPATGSKWSDSTPSDNAFSPPPPRDELSPIQSQSLDRARQSIAASKISSYGTVSIGYPSRIPGPSGEWTHQSPDDAAAAPTVGRRRSSPTLGKQTKTHKPGSVRAAREGIQVASASFARTTASAESKKIARMPTPNTKIFSISETSPRGRKTSIRKTKSQIAPPKTARSRSKSRYVLDKINGLFSGRRERREPEIPPVPRIRDSFANSVSNSHKPNPSPVEPRKADRSIQSTPPPAITNPTQQPKMPSLSPSSHIALGTSSPTKSLTDESTIEDSFAQSKSVEKLSMHILDKARVEGNPQRKARLLNFAKVLNDSLINAREAQISAETAQYAAKSAQLSYEMTQKGLAMLHKLAESMARGTGYRSGR